MRPGSGHRHSSGRPDSRPPGVPVAAADASQIAEALGAGFALVDRSGRVLLVNGSFAELTEARQSPRTLEGLVEPLFPDADARARALAEIRGVAEDGRVARIAAILERGVCARHLFLQASLFPGADELAPHVVLSLTDVSAFSAPGVGREGADGRLELLSHNRGLDPDPTEIRSDDFFEVCPDLYLVIDGRGRIEKVNRRVVAALGLPDDQIVGRHFYRLLDRATRRRVRGAIDTFAASGVIDNLELTLVGRASQTLEVVATARAIGSREAITWRGAWVLLRDVTRRNQLQRQLRQVDRLAVTGRVAASVAHEINNPLQALLMHLAVVEGDLPANFPQMESWGRIQEGVSRVREIVADLLDLHRGPAHDGEGADANLIIEEALGLTRTQFRKSTIRVRVDLAQDLPRVSIPGRQLYQVILNLLLNAHAAMSEGGRLRVKTRQRRSCGEVVIEIADSGAGIAEAALARIFEPLGSGEEGRGTGLGLFVTYGLIRDAGGHVQIDSLKGRGTSFRVYLPPHGQKP